MIAKQKQIELLIEILQLPNQSRDLKHMAEIKLRDTIQELPIQEQPELVGATAGSSGLIGTSICPLLEEERPNISNTHGIYTIKEHLIAMRKGEIDVNLNSNLLVDHLRDLKFNRPAQEQARITEIIGYVPNGATVNSHDIIDKLITLLSETEEQSEEKTPTLETPTDYHLVSFGRYLLSEEREKRLKQASAENPSKSYEERFRHVYDADIANWKESIDFN